ncbi:MAG TPA: type II secretion protein ATPase [Alphaproteobacteria bacterium]|nr:type II secretion protein ATPase [Alphaproteobacteria bacterium]
MSDHQDVVTHVLLPVARVSLFVRDQDIRDLAESLKSDWRFARVTFDIRDGDVDTAIDTYRQAVSPNLVIVETEEIGDSFTGRLEVLANSCAENTAAVVVGPVNDVYLYRRLIDMGVSDYLVRPVDRDVLIELIAKILIEKLGAPGSRMVAFVGAKGGVGTSMVAQTSALVSSHDLEQKTVIMDAAGGGSYLSVAMGTEAVTTLHEASRVSGSSDQDSFRRMIVKVGDNLSILATGAESVLDVPVSADQFELILNKLMVTFPLVVVDLSQAPKSLVAVTMERAHDVVVVSTPTLPSLRSARSLFQEIKALRGGDEKGLHLVLNQKGQSQGFEVSDQDIETALKIHPDMVINFQPKIFSAAESSGKTLFEVAGSKEVAAQFKSFLIKNMRFSSEEISEKPSDGGSKMLSGFLGKFKSK